MISFLFTEFPVAWPLIAAAFFGGYICGSVPYGLLIGKLSGIGDIRKSGSGNIGATNMLRVGGKKLAALTLLLDALKGSAAVLIASPFGIDYAVMAGLGAFLGHLFPLWLKFKGGKGVATALGVLLALSWPAGLAACATWIAVAFAFRYSSLAALVAIGLSPLYVHLFDGRLTYVTLSAIIALLVWIRHHQNIRRLLTGQESKIALGKKDK